MNFYRNAEGYYDPTAGAALTAIEKQCRQEKAKAERRADYESLKAQLIATAQACGFEFPGKIWLLDKKSGYVFKE